MSFRGYPNIGVQAALVLTAYIEYGEDERDEAMQLQLICFLGRGCQECLQAELRHSND